MTKLGLLIFLFGFWLCNMFGQSPIWKNIDLLEKPEIIQLEVDSIGFMWALSIKGIYRYSGYELRKIFSADSVTGDFLSMGKTDEGLFAIGTSNGTVIVLNPYTNKFSTYKWMSYPITSIHCPDARSKCICTSYGQGLWIKKGSQDTFLSTEQDLLSNEVYEARFSDNDVLIATDQGMQRINVLKDKMIGTSLTDKNGLSDVIVTNLVEDGKKIWLSNFDDRVEEMEFGGKVTSHMLPEKGKINELRLINGLLYVASEAGVFYLNKSAWVKIYPEVGKENVLSIVNDEEGNLWLTSKKKTLVKGSLIFQKYRGIVGEIQTFKFVDDNIWIGNSQGLFITSNENTVQKLSNNITCMATFDGIYYWIGTYNKGLIIVDKNLNIVFQKTGWTGLDNQSVLSIYVKDSLAYISTITGVVEMHYKIINRKIEIGKIENLSKQIGDGYIYQVLEDGAKKVFATDRQGLKIWDHNKLTNVTHFANNEKIGSVFSMALDQKGTLWFASSTSGLGYLIGNIAFKQSNLKRTLSRYTSIIPTKDGNLLLISASSIDVFDPVTKHLMYYDKELDIAAETSFLNNFDYSGNKVLFAHNNQLYEYNMSFRPKIDPQILIEKVKVNLIDVGMGHFFAQNDNNIQFEFTAAWLTDPDKLVYQYQLKGLDEHWRLTKDRTVSYPKLPPGDYTFIIRASENDQFGNEPQSTFSFEIKRDFYRTWWFVTLLFFGFIIGLYKYLSSRRKNLLLKSEIERKHVESQLENLKSQLNPHFLFNSFNTLMGLIEENDKERSLSFVDKLTDFYRLVLEHGKDQLVDFQEELRLVELYIDLLNERFDNAIHLNLPEQSIQSQIPPLTLQLLVENAVKHNELGLHNKLEISIVANGDYFIVKNNKKLKMYPVISSGSGLANIKKRYLLLNSKKVEVEDSHAYFAVKLPII